MHRAAIAALLSARACCCRYTHANEIKSTEPAVGPGSYKPDFALSGGRSTMAGKVQRSASFGRSAAFRMSSVRDITSSYFGEHY